MIHATYLLNDGVEYQINLKIVLFKCVHKELVIRKVTLLPREVVSFRNFNGRGVNF